MPTIGKTWVRFNFRYYFYALIFLVLDIFVVFLYPWASAEGPRSSGFHHHGRFYRHYGRGLCICLEKEGPGMEINNQGMLVSVPNMTWTEAKVRLSSN